MRGRPRMSEEEVLEFVNEHHSELVRSIDWLREQRPDAYEKAMRSLSMQVTRLEFLKSTQSERYETELPLWKLQSRIRLLVGRQAVDPKPENLATLKELIGEELELRLNSLKMEKQAMEVAIERVRERQAEKQREIDDLSDPVSYTHLTLPTICSV